MYDFALNRTLSIAISCNWDAKGQKWAKSIQIVDLLNIVAENNLKI